MEPFFAEYLGTLEKVHGEFTRAIEGLPVDAVNWSPCEGANSLAVLAVHAAGAQRFWIGDIAMGEPLPRDRASEFLVHGVSAETALARLESALRYAQAALERLTVEDLSTIRIVPRDGEQVTVAWALLHALEHTAMHAGHAQLTRQLWEEQATRR